MAEQLDVETTTKGVERAIGVAKQGLNSTQWAIVVLAVLITCAVCYFAERLEPTAVPIIVIVLGVSALLSLSLARGKPTPLSRLNEDMPGHPLSAGIVCEHKHAELRHLRILLDALFRTDIHFKAAVGRAEAWLAFSKGIWACYWESFPLAVARVFEVLSDEDKLTFAVFLKEHRGAWGPHEYASRYYDIFTRHLPPNKSSELYRILDDLRMLVKPYIQNEPAEPTGAEQDGSTLEGGPV